MVNPLNPSQQTLDIVLEDTTKKAKIVELAYKGYSVGKIAKQLDCNPQYVRNVYWEAIQLEDENYRQYAPLIRTQLIVELQSMIDSIQTKCDHGDLDALQVKRGLLQDIAKLHGAYPKDSPQTQTVIVVGFPSAIPQAPAPIEDNNTILLSPSNYSSTRSDDSEDDKP